MKEEMTTTVPAWILHPFKLSAQQPPCLDPQVSEGRPEPSPAEQLWGHVSAGHLRSRPLWFP